MAKKAAELDGDDSSDGADKKGPIGTLTRGLVILDLLIESARPLTLVEIASRTGLDQSTALRILRSLEEARYVLRIGRHKEYGPSPKALRPLSHLHPLEQFRRDALPNLIGLSQKISATVVMALFIETERMVLEIVQKPEALSPFYKTWMHRPLHCTAAGKAVLMGMNDEQRLATLGPGPYASLTPNTLTTFAALQDDLRISAERGYVLAAEEHQIGLSAMAVTIKNWTSQVIGCLIVTDHADGMKLREAQIAAEMINSARLLPYQTTSLMGVAQLFGQTG